MSFIKRDSEETQLSQAEQAQLSLTFGTCDLALFRSGRHADCIIECGDQQFPVHKAILHGRCGWFREALREIGELQEPEEPMPIIEVTGQQPGDIEAILVFIYSGEIDPAFFPNEAYPSACVRLYNLGHDFHVTNLSDFATTELGHYLSNVLKSICDQRLWVPAHNPSILRRTEIQHRLREANFVTNFLAAVERADRVRLAGRTETERLRPFQMLVDFFIAGKELLAAEPDFTLWLEADVVPGFAKSVLLTETRGAGCRSKWMMGLVARPLADEPGRQGLCVDCHAGLRNIKECGGPGAVNPRSWKGSYTKVLCKRCLERDRNLGEDGLLRWDVFSPRKD